MRIFKIMSALLAGVAICLSGAAFAAGGGATPSTTPTKRVPMVPRGGGDPLVCQVKGTPIEFPNDIVVINVSNDTYGLSGYFEWRVGPGGEGLHGTFGIPTYLKPGDHMWLHNVIPGGASPTAPCKIVIHLQ